MRAAVLFVALAACAAPARENDRGGMGRTPLVTLAFHDVRVFDGVHVSEHRNVLVSGGGVYEIDDATKAAIPAGAQVIEGSGATLMPGLIDAHAHVNGEADLREALDFGVTTEIDMYSSPESSIALSKKNDAAPDRARVVPAGYGATTAGGHGTEYGVPVPTLSTPAEADEFVAQRVSEGSHHLKIILETGKELGLHFNSLDLATTTALVAAAHARGLLAVAHVGDAADVREALDAGVDGLMHSVVEPLDAATIAQIAAKHVFVTPTLTVNATICGQHPGDALMADARIASMLGPDAVHGLASTFPPLPKSPPDCDAPAAQVRALHAAGVLLLAGTDAPNPGTAHGASVHDELARLVKAGLTPIEALTAATSAPAVAFKLERLGTIVPGADADLLLVDGDPTKDITATRAIRGVWRAGKALDLAARKKLATDARAEAKAASSKLLGPLADFAADGDATKRFTAASDKLYGGTSTSKIAFEAPGHDGKTGRALVVTGEVIAPPGQRGFAGVNAVLAAMQPADLGSAKKLHFWVRGQLASGSLFMITGPGQPSTAKFEISPEWKQVTIDLTTLGPRDAVLLFSWAVTAPGPFSFRLDGVSLE